jgi:hypothetical protein
VAAVVAVLAFVCARSPALVNSRRALLSVTAVAGAIAVLAGPASYSVATVSRSISGNNVLAGPASVASAGGPGGGGGFGPGASGARSGGGFGAGSAGARSGAVPGAGARDGGVPGRASVGARSGGMGGQLSSSVIAYLEQHQGSAKYLLAASGSQTTAPIIIETGRAVVTIGGFNGGDPAPTVTQLAAMVASGELKYVLIPGGSGAGAPGGSGAGGHSGTSAIATWVKAHGTAVTGLTVSGGTIYKVG